MLFSWLTEKGVLAMNPAREVKTERFSRTEGKMAAFVEGEVQKLLDAIETSTYTGLRDRALLRVLAYTFAPDRRRRESEGRRLFPSGKRFLLRFKDKGGKEKELPVHHKLEELLDEYLKATGLGAEPGSPLFPASIGREEFEVVSSRIPPTWIIFSAPKSTIQLTPEGWTSSRQVRR